MHALGLVELRCFLPAGLPPDKASMTLLAPIASDWGLCVVLCMHVVCA
jgi:hypothetical protein